MEFASLRSENEIFPLFREGYLLLVCAHTLVPKHKASFVKSGEPRTKAIQYHLQTSLWILFSHIQDPSGVSVTRGLAAHVKPTYRKAPCCSPLGRRAKLPQALSFIVKDHPLELAGKLPQSSRVRAGLLAQPRCLQQKPIEEKSPDWVVTWADAVLQMADHQGSRGLKEGLPTCLCGDTMESNSKL